MSRAQGVATSSASELVLILDPNIDQQRDSERLVSGNKAATKQGPPPRPVPQTRSLRGQGHEEASRWCGAASGWGTCVRFLTGDPHWDRPPAHSQAAFQPDGSLLNPQGKGRLGKVSAGRAPEGPHHDPGAGISGVLCCLVSRSRADDRPGDWTDAILSRGAPLGLSSDVVCPHPLWAQPAEKASFTASFLFLSQVLIPLPGFLGSPPQYTAWT